MIRILTILIFLTQSIAADNLRPDQRSYKRFCTYPFLSGTTLRLEADWFLDEGEFTPEKIQDGDLVFINAGDARILFEQFHNKIKAKYILGYHLCTCEMPRSIRFHLKSETLARVFAKNVTFPHKQKLVSFPIGIFPWLNISNRYLTLYHHLHTKYPKKHLVYVNFSDFTFRTERGKVRKYFEECGFATFRDKTEFKTYALDVAQSYFVASPRGAGWDCYRTWEAMQLGAIPIVKHSCLDPLFEDLPVLLIDDWKEVTEDFLRKKWKEMQGKTYKREKLFADYWIRKIHEAKNEIRGEHRPLPPELRDENPYLKMRLDKFSGRAWGIHRTIPQPLKNFFKKHPCTKIVDVGAKKALRSAQLCTFLPFAQGRVYTFSNWTDLEFNDYLSYVTHCWRTRQIRPFRKEGQEALKFLQLTPDLIFFNAEQGPENYKINLSLWPNILDTGGLLMGDGWNNPAIQQCVTNFAKTRNIEVHAEGEFWHIEL